MVASRPTFAGRVTRGIAPLALLVTGGLVLAGCTTPDTADGDAPAADSGLSIIAVGGPLADPFWGTVQKGGQDAADLLGAKFEFTAPNDFSNGPADLAQLIQAAIGKDPDVLLVGDFIPPAEDDLIKQAVEAGIKVVVINSGSSTWESVGALTYVGEDPNAVGTAAGEGEAAAGVTNGVCVNHIPENPVLQVRCDGFIAALSDAGGTGDTLTIPSTTSGDQQAVQQAIAGYLNSHPDVNGVFTLGTGIAVAAEKAVSDGGLDVKIGTTDISTQVLNDVKSGALLFTIDQQPYLQGYYGVTVGVQSVLYGIHPVSPIYTAPLVINADDVDGVLEAQKSGVRGAS